MRAQKGFSVEGHDESCLYRSGKGRKCAVGMLIPDSKYRPSMDGEMWTPAQVGRALGWEFLFEEGYGFLEDVQCELHDNLAWATGCRWYKTSFERVVQSFAKEHALKVPAWK